ncbi:hypothetical protein BDV26DRAFT_296779 [Aspergillus bertholletiae]|uniref:Uncharacterized protein n=1 Tax=Aspergillus bertholletiae TaxID=1226010 RepID=A0A5N7AWB9_9EURO|nr:hypothetical protein BDV26DRAFT_296779 [Aspergillus bertholletiae]
MAFTTINGQVYTPGLAIVDSPQPYTPLGGDTLQLAIDVSGNGQLSSSSSSDATQFHAITLFLTSHELSKNFTISNGTEPNNKAYVGPVLEINPSTNVQQVDWVWSACLVGDDRSGSDTARGPYNISIHQSFKWDGKDYHTIFDLPVNVSNSIPKSDRRIDCGLLENDLLKPAEIAASNDTLSGQPWVDADAGTNGGHNNGSSSGDGETNNGVHVRGTLKQWGLFAMLVGGLLLV